MDVVLGGGVGCQGAVNSGELGGDRPSTRATKTVKSVRQTVNQLSRSTLTIKRFLY